MEHPLPQHREIAPNRYRETSGLYFEDFVPGDVFEHRPGRTITDVDNIWTTLLTMNSQPVHFDAAYAAHTEWGRLLVDSTFTLAVLTGMSVRTVSAKVVAEPRLGQGARHRAGVRRRHALRRDEGALGAGIQEPTDPGHRRRRDDRPQPGRRRRDDLRAHHADLSSATGRRKPPPGTDLRSRHPPDAARSGERRARDSPIATIACGRSGACSGAPGGRSRRTRGACVRVVADVGARRSSSVAPLSSRSRAIAALVFPARTSARTAWSTAVSVLGACSAGRGPRRRRHAASRRGGPQPARPHAAATVLRVHRDVRRRGSRSAELTSPGPS